MPWWKYVANRFLTGVENLAFGLRLSEYHTGYRAFSREVLEAVNFRMNSDGFVFDQEIIAQAVAARLPHRRDRRARPLLPGGLVGELLGLVRLRAQDPLGGRRATCSTGPGSSAPAGSDAAGPVPPPRCPGVARRALIVVRLLDVAAGAARPGPGERARRTGGRGRRSSSWSCSASWRCAPPGRPGRAARARPRRVVAGGIAAYALVFSFVTVTRHQTFQTHALDLGYYVQLVWNLAGGRGARVSLPEMHAWGDHLSPIMYLFVPGLLAGPGPGGRCSWRNRWRWPWARCRSSASRARRLGDERPAAAFAVLYLLNPSLHGINVRDFHAAALAIPLLLAALYFVEAGRPWLFALAAARRPRLPRGRGARRAGPRRLARLAQPALALGRRRRARSPSFLVVDVRCIIPCFRGEPYPHLGRYARHGASLGEIVAGPLLHPLARARHAR